MSAATSHGIVFLVSHRLNVDSGKLKGYEKMVTGRIDVDNIVEKGFKELINNKDKHCKILVSPKKGLVT